MTKESWKIVVKLRINNLQVVLEVGAKVFYITENLLEIFFYNSQYAS